MTTISTNTSITLGTHFQEFTSQRVQSGRYGSTSEVVRAGLRLLEDTESKKEALRSALIAGEQSGVSKNFNSTNTLESFHKRYITK